MPTLTLSNIRKEVKSPLDSPTKLGPPDLITALEFLFRILEGMGYNPPVAEWFVAEAFAVMQIRKFKTSPELQHFLHQFLGFAYIDGYSMTTYYLPVLYAYILQHMFMGMSCEKVIGRMRSVLGLWNVREKDGILQMTERWLQRTVDKLMKVTTDMMSPNGIYEVAYERVGILRKRGYKLARAVENAQQK